MSLQPLPIEIQSIINRRLRFDLPMYFASFDDPLMPISPNFDWILPWRPWQNQPLPAKSNLPNIRDFFDQKNSNQSEIPSQISFFDDIRGIGENILLIAGFYFLAIAFILGGILLLVK